MKPFAQKKEELTSLKDKLSRSKITIFTSFAREGEKGLNVSDMCNLKKDLRAVDSEYVIGKKTLFDLALAQSPTANRLDLASARPRAGQSPINVFEYAGSVGAALGYNEPQATAKALYNFAKKHPALKYFGAIWNGKFMGLAEFTEFAKLPSKEVMIARLLGMMKHPLSVLANILDQITKKR